MEEKACCRFTRCSPSRFRERISGEQNRSFPALSASEFLPLRTLASASGQKRRFRIRAAPGSPFNAPGFSRPRVLEPIQSWFLSSGTRAFSVPGSIRNSTYSLFLEVHLKSGKWLRWNNYGPAIELLMILSKRPLRERAASG